MEQMTNFFRFFQPLTVALMHISTGVALMPISREVASSDAHL